jgi:hypothetical protein
MATGQILKAREGKSGVQDQRGSACGSAGKKGRYDIEGDVRQNGGGGAVGAENEMSSEKQDATQQRIVSDGRL